MNKLKVLYQGKEIEVEQITKFINNHDCNCGDMCDCPCCGHYEDYYKTDSGELLEISGCSLIMNINQIDKN